MLRKPWDRDSSFHHMIALILSLVSCDQILCRWVRRFPRTGVLKRDPYTEIAWERLQIDTDLLLIITISALTNFPGGLTSMTLKILNPKTGGFSDFFLRFEAARYISIVNCAEITAVRYIIINLRMKFLTLTVDFNSTFRPPMFNDSSVRGRQIWVPLQNARFLLLLTNLAWKRLQKLAVRYRLAAYHNKQCWRAFWEDQH